MKAKANLFSLSRNLDSLLAAALGFFLIQLFCKHSGIGVSPDSVTYISAARHMIQGNGFISFEKAPVVDFPFAYPFFLTIISFLSRLDSLQFGCALNGLLFGILLYTSGSILNGFQKPSVWYKRILLFCILFSPALQEVYSMLWSETLFLLLILFFIVSISQYLKQPSILWLLISAGFCAIVSITRYAGLFLVLTGCALIILHCGMVLRKRIFHLLIFGSLAISLFVINILRNLHASGLAMGLRPKSDTGPGKILEYFGGVLCDWLPIGRTNGMAVFLSILVLLIFTTTFVYIFFKNKKTYSYEYILAVTGGVYCLFMFTTSVLIRYEQFTNRLLSPMFIPLLCSASWWIPAWVSHLSYRLKWICVPLILLVTAWFLNNQLAIDYEYYDGVKDAGIPGYREDPFVQSDIVQFLLKNKDLFDPAYPIYSNAGDAVYIVTGLTAFQLPFTDYRDKMATYYQGFKDRRSEYLVWFNNEEDSQMPDLNTILKNKKMVLLKELPDGAVYLTK